MSAAFPEPDQDDLTMRVARNVRAEMARRGVTQMQMAEVLGLSQTAVSKRLRGLTPMDTRDLQKIAAAFGMKAAALLGELPRRDSNLQPAGCQPTAGESTKWGQSRPRRPLALTRPMPSIRRIPGGNPRAFDVTPDTGSDTSFSEAS